MPYHCQGFVRRDVEYVGQKGPCRPWERILITCASSIWRNSRWWWKLLFVFLYNNSVMKLVNTKMFYWSYGSCMAQHDPSPANRNIGSVNGPLTRNVKIAGAHAPEMPGCFSQPPRVSNLDMHHGTCVTHVPWCMPGSLTSGFPCSRQRGKRSRHFRRMDNPLFYVSGTRPPREWLSD